MGKREIIITIILFVSIFIVFFGAIILFIRQYKLKKTEHLLQLQSQKEEHRKELLTTQLEIQQQTMQYIGREIHDDIGQKLTLACLYVQQLSKETKTQSMFEKIDAISDIINQSLVDLRNLSKSLTNDVIASKSIVELLTKESRKVNILQKCHVRFIFNDEFVEINYQQKSVLVRIAQEFIQNSLKYANCSQIDIELLTQNAAISLKLSDNGIGFDSNKNTTGMGLQNMKKRTEIIGGKFNLESSNRGTVVFIKIDNA